jgi:hypothetical protein
LTKSQVGLGNVENTALSTWAGTSNFTTIGTLVAGAVPARLVTGLSITTGNGVSGTVSSGAFSFSLGAITPSSATATGGILSSGATAGVGYATGAGGTVTQSTNRTTGVTLNTVCGQITCNSTSLAANANATFTVTDSAVVAGDTVTVNMASYSTGLPMCWVQSVNGSGGSFQITVRNMHASTADTTADKINFTVHKSVTN